MSPIDRPRPPLILFRPCRLDLDERVLDVIAYWHRLFEEEKAKGDDAKTKKDKKKSMGNNFYRVVFKVALYIDIPIEDVAAQHHLFVQAHFDIVSAVRSSSIRLLECATYP